jgi:hypothetical protein
MTFVVLPCLLLAAAGVALGTSGAIWLLLASQLFLLIGQVRARQVSGVGGFIFMYFLFFGMRPLYMYLENDMAHFTGFFLIRVNVEVMGSAMWWATLALICFVLGAQIAPAVHRRWLNWRAAKSQMVVATSGASMAMCASAVALQVVTLPVMYYIATLQRGIYGSDLGAYLYDLPMPMQAIHIFAVAILAGRYWKTRSLETGLLLALSVVFLLTFTWFMREVTNFRGFYLSGIIVVGLAVLHQLKQRVGYAWLIIPIIAAQPFFAYLGAERGKSNEELAEAGIVAEAIADEGLLESYWHFYQGGRDMNIFDTFVAAKQHQPRWHPYAWSWAYVPLHWIPRAFWDGKPKQGLTQDVSFARGAPLSPGIAGFFLLDGGLLWMLGSMALLGYLLALLDLYLLTMPRGYLRSCLIGIVVVNSMFLSRLLLWQFVYQMLYMMAVVIALAWLMQRPGQGRPKIRRRPAHAHPLRGPHDSAEARSQVGVSGAHRSIVH